VSRAGRIAAAAALAALAVSTETRADWRELRLGALAGGAGAWTTHAGAPSPDVGLGGVLGAEASYGVSDSVELGATLRLASASGLAYDGVTVTSPDPATPPFTGRLTASARTIYLGPALRIQRGDNRIVWFASASAGYLRRSLGAAALVVPGVGKVAPYDAPGTQNDFFIPDDVASGLAAGGSLGAEVRFRAHYTLGIRIEGLLSVTGEGRFAGLVVPLELGYRFYLF
jgi:hypothetical protein